MARKRSGAWSAGITGAALGIAAGTALGAYVLAPEGGIEWGGAQAAEERDAAIVERDSANTRADAANSVVEDLAAQVVDGSLSDVPALLVTTPDADSGAVDAMEQLLRDAGSPEISRMGLTEKFRSAEGADELKDVVTTALPAGTELDLLTGLGNGYDLEPAGERPLLLGGGVGVPPLYELAKRLAARGLRPAAVLGFNTAADVFYADKFAEFCDLTLVTADGSAGQRGFVTDAMPAPGAYSYFYACGPLPMLKAVRTAAASGGQLSLEERMACGFGACVGCTIETRDGARRVCKDGPVFRKEELLW